MRFDDDDIPESGGGPPPDPSMRQWRHPSEIAAAASAAARPDPPSPKERRTRATLASTFAIAAVATVVVGLGAVVVTTIGFGGADLELEAADDGLSEAEAGLTVLTSIAPTVLRTTAPTSATSTSVPVPSTGTATTTEPPAAETEAAPAPNGLYAAFPPEPGIDTTESPLTGQRLGSFVVLGDLILTSASMLTGHDDLHLVVDGAWTPVAVIGADPVTDLALLDTVEGSAEAVELAPLSKQPMTGDGGGMPDAGAAVYLSSPEALIEGSLVGPKGRVVTPTGDKVYGVWLTEIHAPNGSTGAAVTDADGLLVGLVVNSPDYYASLVSAETMLDVGSSLQEWGLPALEWIGLITEDADQGGVTVQLVEEGGPGSVVDIQPGDRLIEFNGRDVHDPHHLSHLVRNAGMGNSVAIVVERNGQLLGRSIVIEPVPVSADG